MPKLENILRATAVLPNTWKVSRYNSLCHGSNYFPPRSAFPGSADAAGEGDCFRMSSGHSGNDRKGEDAAGKKITPVADESLL